MCVCVSSPQMPPRPLEPLAKRLLKGLIAVELLGVLGAYGLFQQMNSSRGDGCSSCVIVVETELDFTFTFPPQISGTQ